MYKQEIFQHLAVSFFLSPYLVFYKYFTRAGIWKIPFFFCVEILFGFFFLLIENENIGINYLIPGLF